MWVAVPRHHSEDLVRSGFMLSHLLVEDVKSRWFCFAHDSDAFVKFFQAICGLYQDPQAIPGKYAAGIGDRTKTVDQFGCGCPLS